MKLNVFIEVPLKVELPDTKREVMTDCGWMVYDPEQGKWYRRIDSEVPWPAPEKYWMKQIDIQKFLEITIDAYVKQFYSFGSLFGAEFVKLWLREKFWMYDRKE